MCVNHKKTDLYNGYMIGDMFADEENYPKYKNNIRGQLIVECSYFTYLSWENAILFNYPTDFRRKGGHDVIKVKFNNKTTFEKYKEKLEDDHTHIQPIAIAGNWSKPAGGHACDAFCKFYSGRQIYIVK